MQINRQKKTLAGCPIRHSGASHHCTSLFSIHNVTISFFFRDFSFSVSIARSLLIMRLPLYSGLYSAQLVSIKSLTDCPIFRTFALRAAPTLSQSRIAERMFIRVGAMHFVQASME